MPSKKLSDFELEVLQHFWQMRQASTPEIHREIAANRDVKYSTVRTIVDRLEQKAAIERLPLKGRAVIFRPLLTRAEVKTPMTRKFIERVFGGDSRSLLSHLLDDEALNAEDIAYLESIIARRKKVLNDND